MPVSSFYEHDRKRSTPARTPSPTSVPSSEQEWNANLTKYTAYVAEHGEPPRHDDPTLDHAFRQWLMYTCSNLVRKQPRGGEKYSLTLPRRQLLKKAGFRIAETPAPVGRGGALTNVRAALEAGETPAEKDINTLRGMFRGGTLSPKSVKYLAGHGIMFR